MSIDVPANAFTAPWWDGLRRNELLVPTCRACGTRHFTPRPRCPACRSADVFWDRSSGLGEVYSYTIVCRKPAEGFDVPFVLALITMEEGWNMMSHVAGIAPDSVHIGMKVKVRFDNDGTRILPRFVPTT
jgi:uncharacterized OB-fold protein